MRKTFAALFAALALGLSGVTAASVVHVTHTAELPEFGTGLYDLDGDGTNDIGLAEDCCSDERLWINGNGFATDFQFAFVSPGSVIDGALSWVSGVSGYTADIPVGTSYIATRNTSVGDYFGYFSVDFNAADIFLTGFWYEDSGRAITVGSAAVPEPSMLLLLGLGLAALGVSRRRRV